MTWQRIKNVMFKEWAVAARDINSVTIILLLPLIIVAQLILYVWLISRFGGDSMLNASIFQTALDKLKTAIPAVTMLPPKEQLQVLLVSQFNFYLLLIPTMIAINFATFGIVEEKMSRSLEPLLATPVRTWELLLGKALSGAIPALIMTWISALIFVAGIQVIGWGYLVSLAVNGTWFTSLFLLTPAITVLSFMLGVIGSSRAADPKSAQNYSVAIIFPVFGLIALQITGVVWFNLLNSLLLGLGLVVLDIVILRLAVGLFQRESIILKWH